MRLTQVYDAGACVDLCRHLCQLNLQYVPPESCLHATERGGQRQVVCGLIVRLLRVAVGAPRLVHLLRGRMALWQAQCQKH